MIRYIATVALLLWGLALMPTGVRTVETVWGDDSQGGAPAGDAQPSRWPMRVTSAEGADVTIFQPQLVDFQGDALTGRAAVAVIPSGQQEPVFGAIWLQSRVETDRAARTVRIVDVQVTKVLFPAQSNGGQPISVQSLSDSARQAMLAQPITLSLDHLLASLETIQKTQASAADLQSTPPAIVFKDHPAVKVQYDGDPRLVQAGDNGLMRVVNTPFFVALDPGSKTYFLKGAGHWFSAPDPMGPFQNTTQVPQPISQLADQIGYSDPQQAIPDDEVSRLEIVTASSPTELIWTDGQPQMSTIPGTGLLYWANTDSNVFMEISTQKTFALLSGRWYSAGNISGPWTSVPPEQLPADFAKIPTDSPRASVLAQVPGTQQAQDAVADTYIPQTAAVDSTNYDQPPVTYDGDPDFEPVQGTQCSYAVNTDCSVLSEGGFYYCCYNAVWYQCQRPSGPWVISYRVPQDIYGIPPSCPLYPVTFVHIYGHSGQVVYVGYTPGYVGCYPYQGVVVYGTGYRYQPWFKQNYIPRPSTFGYAAEYHPYSGRWGFSFGLASGGGQTWIAAAGKGRADSNWFGYGGYRPSNVPTTLKINRTIIDTNNVQRATYDVNVYQRRNDLHPEARGVTPNNVPKQNPSPERNAHPKPNPQPVAAHPELNSNDVYVNPQGDVYRHTDSGWQTRQGNDWKAQPAENAGQPKSEEHAKAPPAENANPQGGENHVNNPPPAENSQPAREEPARAEPAPASPPPARQEPSAGENERNSRSSTDNGERGGPPERDYQARQQGEERGRQSSPAPAPAAPPTPPAEAPAGGGHSGHK